MKTKNKTPKVSESPTQPPIAPLQNAKVPQPDCCQAPDPKIVSAAWNLDRWSNRIRNATEALESIDHQRQTVVDEIQILRMKRDAAQRDLLTAAEINVGQMMPSPDVSVLRQH